MTDEQRGVVTTGIYTLENGAIVKVYNPRYCYLTCADGQAIVAYEEVLDGNADAN